ncbi:MAG: minor capsid protein [Phycisphaeraceae bacterium]|nr:minor capsid protein [Phycisphaeraceae bacterium]
MIRFNLAEVAASNSRGTGQPARAKGTIVKLPRIEETIGSVNSYKIALRTMLRGIAKDVRENILPVALAEIKARKAEERLQRDMGGEELEGLRLVTETLVAAATGLVGRIIGLESQRHSKQFMRQARRALGIDLAAVIHDEDLGEYLRTASARNASLIKSLSEDAIKRVEQTVIAATIDGDTATKLRAELTKQFGVLNSRANLIATDQMAKLNSDLNMIRHTQAGIAEYFWQTAEDEKVRAEHNALNGQKFRYDRPTTEKDGLRPGQPIRCRCIAIAVVQF